MPVDMKAVMTRLQAMQGKLPPWARSLAARGASQRGAVRRLGVDIGWTSLKVVELEQQDGTVKVLHAATAPLAPITDATPRDPELVAAALKGLLQREGITPAPAVSAFEPGQVFLKEISFPRLPEDELVKAIQWEAEKHLPYPRDEAVIEFQIADEPDSQAKEMTVILIAARKAACLTHLDILKRAGIHIQRLDAVSCGIARAISKCFPEQIVATLDIGASGAEVVIQRGSGLRLMRRMDIGGDHFTNALPAAPTAGDERAAALTNAESPVGKVLAELARQLTRSIAYCEARFPEEKIAKVLLCGGGALWPSLPERLAEAVGLPVELAKPYNVEPQLVGCLGLALEG